MQASQQQESIAQRVNQWLEAMGDSAYVVKGMDAAIIGLTYDKVVGCWRVCYDVSACLDIFMQRDGMTYEQAVEFYNFNIADAYYGDSTPIFIEQP